VKSVLKGKRSTHYGGRGTVRSPYPGPLGEDHTQVALFLYSLSTIEEDGLEGVRHVLLHLYYKNLLVSIVRLAKIK
jgi:hypothetical protein